MFGWSVGKDLYVVPDHAHCIMKTDHHDVVHVSFRDEASLQKFVSGMQEEDFVLPDHPPDPTFRTPKWMEKE